MLENLNYTAIAIASIVNFVIGWLWYSPMAFKSLWLKEAKLEGVVGEKPEATTLIAGYMLTLISAFIFAVLTECLAAEVNLMTGMVIPIGIIITSIGTNYLFEKRTVKHFFINAGNLTVNYLVMGGIIWFWD